MDRKNDEGKDRESPTGFGIPEMLLSKTPDLEDTVKGPELYPHQPLSPEFQRQLKRLYHLPMNRSLYRVTRCLWELWQSDPPEQDTFWLVAVGPQLDLCGLAVISERTRSNWSNYCSIDDSVSWDQTINFQITRTDIGFGPNEQPSFWGLFRHLQNVSKQLMSKRKKKRK